MLLSCALLLAAYSPSRAPAAQMPLPPPRSARAMPGVIGAGKAALPLVVIDAGHGGHDPGAVNAEAGVREKEVTLALAKRLARRLTAGGIARVALTRDDDRFLLLEDRYAAARRLGADLFISIHADAAPNPEARGGSVYTLSDIASDAAAQRLATRENRADVIAGADLGARDSEVASILVDLAQRETMALSTRFAKTLARLARDRILMRDPAHRFASFVVLKAPDVASVLFEAGYLTNDDDVKTLASPAGQQAIASALAEAIRVHFARADAP